MSATHGPADPVMEAFGALARSLGHTGGTIQWPAIDAMMTLLRVHAHELAEQIRAADPGDLGAYNDDEAAGAYLAADLIDPEVSS